MQNRPVLFPIGEQKTSRFDFSIDKPLPPFYNICIKNTSRGFRIALRMQGAEDEQGNGVQIPALTNTVNAENPVRWRKPVIGGKSSEKAGL